MNAKEQLDLLMKALDIKQGVLATKLEVDVQRLKDIQRGKIKNMPPDISKAMVDKLHVNPEWLISKSGPLFKDQSAIAFEKKMVALQRTTQEFALDDAMAISDADKEIIETAQLCSVTDWTDRESRARAIDRLVGLRGRASEYQLVPRSSARPSAGHGALIESEQIVDYMAFKKEWLQRILGISHADLALVEVRGDSMAGTLDDGDLALVDMRQNRLDVSAVFVIQVDDALLVKRVQRKLNGTVIIKSDNKAYEPEILAGEQLESLKVLGRVVWPRLR